VVRLAGEREIPAVLVAHELPDAQAFATRLAIIDAGRLLQEGAPDEVVLRPASRRVAELVGYRGFVPVQPQRGATVAPAGPDQAGGPVLAGVHPDRVVAGAHPDRGIVLSGTMRGGRPAGAAWEADLLIGTAEVTCRLDSRPEARDGRLVVTAIDPPCFGADGTALRPGDPGPEIAWPVQAGA
jgi:ABC-type sugar transport system ATPase subunit